MSEKTSNFDTVNYVTVKENEITVFPSALNGKHKSKFLKLGAVKGCGIGLRGNTYALPTRDYLGRGLTKTDVKHYVKTFLNIAKEKKELTFYVLPLEQYRHDLFDIDNLPANVILITQGNTTENDNTGNTPILDIPHIV